MQIETEPRYIMVRQQKHVAIALDLRVSLEHGLGECGYIHLLRWLFILTTRSVLSKDSGSGRTGMASLPYDLLGI